ncbi:hypothetical protein PGTUg99_006773 [Puccinia graminis f. sp. tritici]|uniref:Uncharacterized protein n=1 Tax=Puccinia graminis f. sp. tritici TaxID=56615 RepID=A0A5B0RBQ7_PUCGR|nr:hypothetical protein PGTUg99_006773 [Puccinia graminis f. sp. tritici]
MRNSIIVAGELPPRSAHRQGRPVLIHIRQLIMGIYSSASGKTCRSLLQRDEHVSCLADNWVIFRDQNRSGRRHASGVLAACYKHNRA